MTHLGSLRSFYRDVALGDEPGTTSGIASGVNPEVDTTTTAEDVWDGSGIYPGQPVGDAETVTVVSTSADDTEAGDGARSVMIRGLDENWALASEEIATDGVTPAESVNSYRRVFTACVPTAGSTGGNVGTITVAHSTTTANVFAKMRPKTNYSLAAVLTVAAGKTLQILAVRFSMTRISGVVGSADVSLRVREDGSTYQAVIYTGITTGSPYNGPMETGLIVPEKADLKMTIDAVSDNDTTVTGKFEYILIDDPDV